MIKLKMSEPCVQVLDLNRSKLRSGVSFKIFILFYFFLCIFRFSLAILKSIQSSCAWFSSEIHIKKATIFANSAKFCLHRLIRNFAYKSASDNAYRLANKSLFCTLSLPSRINEKRVLKEKWMIPHKFWLILRDFYFTLNYIEDNPLSWFTYMYIQLNLVSRHYLYHRMKKNVQFLDKHLLEMIKFCK